MDCQCGVLTFKPSTPRGLPAPRSNAAARSRNTRSQPTGYPFKLKAALASPLVAEECAIPVLCGPAIGADAPNRYDVPRLCGPQAPGHSSQSKRRIARLAQLRAKALERQGGFSATGRGL